MMSTHTNFDQTVTAIDEELIRAKQWCNENEFNVGTAVYQIVRSYRQQLKDLKAQIQYNIDRKSVV